MGRHIGDGGQHGKLRLVERILQEFNRTGDPDSELALTDEENAILERWIFIDGLVRKRRPVIKMNDVMNTTTRRFGISRSQFWEDFKNCDRLFGTKHSKSKAYQRALYVEWLEQLASLAELNKDFRAAKDCLAEAAKLQMLYEKDVFEMEDTEPRQFVLALVYQGNGKDQEQESEVIDLDELHKVKPELFEKIMSMADTPNITPSLMDQMLNNG